MVLAIVAIWYSWQSERKSTDNYNRTKDVLSDISQKASVIEATMNNTQEKLVDTITEIARPRQESQEEILMNALLPSIVQNPELLERLMQAGGQQPK